MRVGRAIGCARGRFDLEVILNNNGAVLDDGSHSVHHPGKRLLIFPVLGGEQARGGADGGSPDGFRREVGDPSVVVVIILKKLGAVDETRVEPDGCPLVE